MSDSSDDGLCDGDSNLKKDLNSNFQKRSPEFFKRILLKFKKSSSVVVVIEGFGAQFFITKMLQS